jgi:hypothetical protein
MDAGIFYALAIHAIIIAACWISEAREQRRGTR